MMLSNALPNSLFLRYIVVLVAAVLVTGCTTLDLVDDDVDTSVDTTSALEQVWNERQTELSSIKYWHLTGRLAVNNGDDAWNLNLDWQQKGDDYQIQINGAFGAGKVKMIGNAHGVLLKDSDDQTFYADTPEMLLYEQTGVFVPVEGLRYWVMGLTSPTQQDKPQLDKKGRLAYLEDANWKVKFKRYTQISGIDLPRKVFLLKNDKELDVRLVVDKWKLGAF